MKNGPTRRGRGSDRNPKNRFETLAISTESEFVDESHDDLPERAPATVFLRDTSRSVIARNESPDVGFDASVNPYRGCEHGCSYCYARPFHEYLGFSAGLDFETKILVKTEAPSLLRRELSSPRWTPQVLALSGVTDPYQPIERSLGITRKCLEVLAEFRNPVVIVTKNRLVTRDVDILAEMSRDRAAAVFVSITTLDRKLGNSMEPRTSSPAKRLAAIEALSTAGIPTGVLVAPIIPGLTDSEIPAIVSAAAAKGARTARYIVLRLPQGVKDLFGSWLENHYPSKKRKVLNRMRSLRGGNLYDPAYSKRMVGEGVFADQIAALFDLACRSSGMGREKLEVSTEAFRASGGRQMELGLG